LSRFFAISCKCLFSGQLDSLAPKEERKTSKVHTSANDVLLAIAFSIILQKKFLLKVENFNDNLIRLFVGQKIKRSFFKFQIRL